MLVRLCHNEQVRFMKIDVQGGGAVLKGASCLIENNLIDMIFVNFRGGRRH